MIAVGTEPRPGAAAAAIMNATVTRPAVLRNGTMDLRLWDGVTFHLRMPETETAGVAIS